MAFGPLVSCEELAQHLKDPTWVVFDCRFDLTDKEKGARDYGKAHIAGAFYAHVERDLSGPVGDGHKGRHPLPLEGAFQRFLSNHGVGPGTKVVAYDDSAGQWASRLWWLLRHYGHADVAVLDGGLARWKALRLPTSTGHEKPRPPSQFKGKAGAMPTVSVADVEASLRKAEGGPIGFGQEGKPLTLVDARQPERYRGETEPIDRRAGRIPGAVNVPAMGNVGADMRWLAPEQLRQRFADVGVSGADNVACYCGSGVTGTQDVLAMEVAGLGTPALYPGSYSEWQFPAAGRPVETGPRIAPMPPGPPA